MRDVLAKRVDRTIMDSVFLGEGLKCFRQGELGFCHLDEGRIRGSGSG